MSIIDEYFGIVKRPTTEEQLAEAHRAMADADAKHSTALRIAHLEGGMEQLTGSVAKHEKKERVLQIWVYILAFSLSISVSIIFGYLAFDSSVPQTGLIRNGKITSLGWMLFALLAVGVGVIIAALINALRYYRHHQTDKNIGQEDKNGKSNEEGQRNRDGV